MVGTGPFHQVGLSTPPGDFLVTWGLSLGHQHSSLEADTRWHGLAQGWGWERLATLQVVPQIITPTTAPGLLPVLCP